MRWQYGPSAPQRNPTRRRRRRALATATAGLPGEGEDCLVLNVWTPAVNDGRKRPVMFWCHGGGFATGSGSSPGTDGTNLARRGDVVVVSINHRLNVLGFTNLVEAFGRDYAQSGDVGMLDIVQALQWVRTNIERFGGDPNTVMIFGQSGGGRKVSTLLTMPSAKGLFHRAVIESGATIKLVERDAAAKVAERLLDEALAQQHAAARAAEPAGAEDHVGVLRRRQGHGRRRSDDRRILADDGRQGRVAASVLSRPRRRYPRMCR